LKKGAGTPYRRVPS